MTQLVKAVNGNKSVFILAGAIALLVVIGILTS